MSNEKLKQIHDDARKNDVPIMLDDGLAFLLQYIRTHESIRDILEIGTAVGYSAINMAAIRWDIVIDTLEVNSEMAAQAEKNIAQENLSERIHVHLGDASVYETKKIYDLICPAICVNIGTSGFNPGFVLYYLVVGFILFGVSGWMADKKLSV